MFCITAVLVQMDSYIGIARLVLLVQCTSCCVSFPVFRPEMLGIMAGMDQESWFAGFWRCPSRCAPLVVSGPRWSSWPAWRFRGAVLERGFSMPVVVLRVSWSNAPRAVFLSLSSGPRCSQPSWLVHGPGVLDQVVCSSWTR